MDDDVFFVLLGVGVVAFLIVLPILGAVAFSRTSRLAAEIAVLRARLDGLGPQPAMPQAVAEPPPLPDIVEPPPFAGDSEPAALPPADASPLVSAEPPPFPAEQFPAQPAVSPPPRERDGGERLAARWTVRIGGIAVALAGIYLVQYSIETGLLGPGARIMLALLLSAALVAGGEWVRRRAVMSGEPAPRGGDQVPAALSGAGVVIGFGAVYAAYALYELIGPTVAFAGLALIAFGALVLALRQGVLLAALGLVGAYCVPVMVSTNSPNAFALFGYLVVVTAAALEVIRYRAWVWLIWATLAASAGWVAIWYAVAWMPGDALAVGPYLLLLSALFAVLPVRSRGTAAMFSPIRAADLAPPERVSIAASIAIALLAFGLLRMDGYSTLSMTIFVVVALGWIAAGRRWQSLDTAPLPWALAAVMAVGAHQVPDLILSAMELGHQVGHAGASFPDLGVPPEADSFLRTTAGFAALFFIGGFAAQWRAQSPGRWALMAAATPLLLLAIAYQRLTDFAPSPPFAGAALGLAVVMLVAAERTARQHEWPGMNAALAAYASTVLGAITLALAMTLRDSWLTVALAWQLPALGWVRRRTGVPALEKAAAAVAALVLARLLLNEFVLDYSFGATPLVNGLLVAYGLPLVAFLLAIRLFALSADAWLTRLLHAGAIAFGTALVTLEIRHLAHDGDLAAPAFGLGEAGALASAWLGGALALLWQDRRRPDPVSRIAAMLLGFAGTLMTAMTLLFFNPLANGEPAPAWPVVNALGLAYGLPALLALGLAREAMLRGQQGAARVAASVALLLAFVFVSFEVRRAFTETGLSLDEGDIGTAEAYTYSAVWLLFAMALFGAGLMLRRPVLRHVGLAALAAVAAKVFLLDMSNLEGLYRVASFLGLGIALIGIGWIHQRTLMRERPDA